MIHDKKGVISSWLVVTIVIIAGAAVLFLFLSKASPLFTEVTEKEACANSVNLRAAIISGAGGPASSFFGAVEKIPLKCTTEEVVITTPDIDTIKQDIANRMYDCWWMMGEGKKQFFTKNLDAKNAYCIICSRITFDKNVKSKFKNITGLGEYLNTYLVPGKNITYMQYFTGYPVPTMLNSGSAEDIIETSNDYIVTFELAQGNYLKQVIGGGAGAAVGAAGGVATGLALAKIGILGGSVLGPAGVIGGAVLGFGVGFVGGWIIGGELDKAFDKYKGDYLTRIQLLTRDAAAIKQFGCTSLENIP